MKGPVRLYDEECGVFGPAESSIFRSIYLLMK